MSQPLVSVIIPTCNSAHYLPATLDAVFAQTWRDFEVLVVDDASTDDTEASLSPYRERIRLLRRDERGGPARARNQALREARGEFIAFVDADDLWLPSKLERQVAWLQEHPDDAVVFTDYSVFDEAGCLSESKKEECGGIPQGRIFHDLLFGRFVAMSTVMLRRSCLDKVGLFDEELTGAEDYNLYLRLAHDYSFGFLDEVLLDKRWHEGNLSHNYGQMCGDEIINLRKIAALFPDTPLPMRRLHAHTYFRFGHYDFSAGRFDIARTRFAQTIRQTPWNARAYAFWAASAMPQSWRDRLSSLNRARKSLGRKPIAGEGAS